MELKSIRISKGLTQQQLADATCIDRALIARYENGSRNPPIEKLQILADFLNVSVDTLIGRSSGEDDLPVEKKEPAVDLSGFDPDLVEALRDVRPEEKAAVLALISGLKASRKG